MMSMKLPADMRVRLGNGLVLVLLFLLALWLWQLHGVGAPQVSRPHLAQAVASVLVYAVFCALLWWRRHRRQQKAEQAVAALLLGRNGKPWLVAHASQTGTAEQLAWQTATALQGAGIPVRYLPLAQVTPALLSESENALFVVSTTGEGDAPDAVAGFVRRVLGAACALPALHYGLLSLGDSSYVNYGAFGKRLDEWLRHQGATPLFDRVDVDDGDEGALRHWQHHLSVLSGDTAMPDWRRPRYARWQLAGRRCLNPGSAGAPAFEIALAPLDDMPSWQAGDIAEVGPRQSAAAVKETLTALGLYANSPVDDEGATLTLAEALAKRTLPHDAAALAALRGLPPQALLEKLEPLPHREYSIASLPADGRIDLLLRQMRQPDGRLGVGSGWLTEFAPLGSEIALRVRANRGFHGPADARPLILIGNGTGLAGLRAHLRERAALGRHRNWLLFGERNRAHDFYWHEEIENWQQSGVLERLDLAFSRDQAERIYVQDVLRRRQAELREWVAAGAAIYVCGSLAGMAPAVAAVLTEALGEATLEQMAEDGRYRRDVY
jgi:sulfite reductase (NADPH) flavoprotein alpha-component